MLPHPDPISGASFSAVELAPDDSAVFVLDQRRLPREEIYYRLEHSSDVAVAIRDMVVRGAPAIGIAAAYGMVLAARAGEDLFTAGALLKATRPTAVNLSWAVDCMLRAATPFSGSGRARTDELAGAARALHREDVEACRTIGRLGAERIPDGAVVLTHCNAGALATGGYGTALGVIRAAHESGKQLRVLAGETRPYLQGARLTAWELSRLGVPVEVIPDSSSGLYFRRGEISLAVVGADRIAANGDVANKVGTYTVACLSRRHERPFYVAAPWSTVDRGCLSGEAISIEERPRSELSEFEGVRLVPDGAGVRNPAFDVTPAELITAVVTERGIIDPVDGRGIARLAPVLGSLSVPNSNLGR